MIKSTPSDFEDNDFEDEFDDEDAFEETND
jgi:hypothetical protein